jgi:hypothetical protein
MAAKNSFFGKVLFSVGATWQSSLFAKKITLIASCLVGNMEIFFVGNLEMFLVGKWEELLVGDSEMLPIDSPGGSWWQFGITPGWLFGNAS